MNILVANDDGIAANGIRVLTEKLSQKHNVYVVAPDRERSAAGHSLTIQTPLRVEELDEGKNGAKRVWVTNGTPGDCVKLGVSALLKDECRPDYVISGINHGPNLGLDILYSGTVSCAMEAAMMGIPGIAVSLASLKTDKEVFETAGNFVVSLMDRVKQFRFPKKSILNVNIPGLETEDIAGVAITELGGKIFTDNYEKRTDPRGKVYYWLAGKLITEPADAPTDITAIRNNMISITPVTYEMTRTEIMSDLDNALCKTGNCNWW